MEKIEMIKMNSETEELDKVHYHNENFIKNNKKYIPFETVRFVKEDKSDFIRASEGVLGFDKEVKILFKDKTKLIIKKLRLITPTKYDFTMIDTEDFIYYVPR